MDAVEAHEVWAGSRGRGRIERLLPAAVPRPSRREPPPRLASTGASRTMRSLLDHDHPVSNGERPIDTLLGEDDRARGPFDVIEERIGGLDVELGRRLVEQEQPGLERERGREADPLQLAPGELDGAALGEMHRADLGERGVGTRPDSSRIDAEVLEPERHFVLDAGHHDLVLRILKDRGDGARELARAVRSRVETADLDTAGEAAAVEVRHEAGKGAEERRLAAPGRTEKRHDLAGLELERDVPKRRNAPRVGEREPLHRR